MTTCGSAESVAQAMLKAPWLRRATRTKQGTETSLLPIGIGRVLAFATDEHKLDRRQQLLQVDRLPDHFLRPHSPSFIEALFVVAPGDDDHAAGVFALAELPEHLDSVHPWHEQIEKDQIGGRLFHHRQGLRAVFHAERPITAETEKLNEQVTNQGLIINDENRFSRISCG